MEDEESESKMVQSSEEMHRAEETNNIGGSSFPQQSVSPTTPLLTTMNVANQFRLPSEILTGNMNVASIVPSSMPGDVKIDGPMRGAQFNPVASGFFTSEKEKSKCPLPLFFAPGQFDVICAKGNKAKNQPGNLRLRKFVEQYSQDYGNSTSRLQKTMLVNQIIYSVRSFNGGFVKFEKGQWHDVGDAMARETVGQSLRERNHSMYRSSTKAKRKKHKELNDKISDHVKTAMTKNHSVAAGVHQLTNTVERHRGTAAAAASDGGGIRQTVAEQEEQMLPSSDELDLELAMTKANSNLLASLKKDQSIQSILKEEDEESKKKSGL
jgi:hypothetical protein